MSMKMEGERRCGREKEEIRLYKIGMFAQMNHVTVKALHFYEEQRSCSPHGLTEEPATAIIQWIR